MHLPDTIVASTDIRFQGTPDGRVWTSLSTGAAYWRAYFAAFDQVVMLARVAEVGEPPAGAIEVEGPGVRVAKLPDFRTPRELATALPRIVRVARRATAGGSFLHAELGMVGLLLVTPAILQRRPFTVRVTGDPDAVFGDAAVGGPLRPCYRYFFRGATRAACRRATGAWYVASYLARKYPPGPRSVSMVSANYLVLDEQAPPRPHTGRPVQRLITVGALEQPYKGVGDLLAALSSLVRRGHNLDLTVVGGGRYLPALVAQAGDAGIGDRTTFTGWVPREAVQSRLAEADLFVLASHTEGQPRALIEAMAMGLPCVGTRVGGIPDLLPEDALASPRSPLDLAGRIEAFVVDPERAEKAGLANLDRTEKYRPQRHSAEIARFFVEAWTVASARQ